ncbi:MAG: hypothetical protein ACE5G3_03470 [Gammaproteobacteria bacterium]
MIVSSPEKGAEALKKVPGLFFGQEKKCRVYFSVKRPIGAGSTFSAKNKPGTFSNPAPFPHFSKK